ncbi:hypothetical protein F5Y04DRAFT_288855 [Hypomontagnella monticulosa]|nr:hypothetical protein F5Y04DRAFT_288855 [Hypomontagnella monticulosa]
MAGNQFRPPGCSGYSHYMGASKNLATLHDYLEDTLRSDIETMYNNGVPLFTKDMLSQISRQLEEYDQALLGDNKIRLKNMKGEEVEFTLCSDEPSGWFEWRCNAGDKRTKPFIFYCSIQRLLSQGQGDMFPFDPQKTCLAVGPVCPKLRKDGGASEEVDPPKLMFHVPTLTRLFELTRQDWETSNVFPEIRTLLKANRNRLYKVDNIVAFALGQLSDGNNFESDCAYQHAFVLSIQRILSEMTTPKPFYYFKPLLKALSKNKKDHDVELYAQDPAYTDSDKEVLADAGIKVLPDPKGFLQVGDNSMVVSISANIPIHQIIADIARPAAIIWDEHETAMDGPEAHSSADPWSPRVEKMLNDEYMYVMFKLPFADKLRHLALYIRKDL